ncbi:MAG TPA: CARDB domain-containing protein [Candidatus Binatia bacterium]|nr:CARDB domain-containing protein [Candidatus Binatia bacterium]
MLAIVIATVLLVAQGPTPQPQLNIKLPAPTIIPEPPTKCSGVDPELLALSVKSVARAGKYDLYTVTAEVKNVGASAEPTNFPQEVDVFRDGHPVATIPVAQLNAGQARTVSTVIEVPQTERHPYFTFRLVDGEAQLPAPKRCKVLHDRLEVHL